MEENGGYCRLEWGGMLDRSCDYNEVITVWGQEYDDESLKEFLSTLSTIDLTKMRKVGNFFTWSNKGKNEAQNESKINSPYKFKMVKSGQMFTVNYTMVGLVIMTHHAFEECQEEEPIVQILKFLANTRRIFRGGQACMEQ